MQTALPAPGSQQEIDAILAALEPEIGSLVGALRTAESWTYLFSEIPRELAALGAELPKVVQLPLGEESDEVVLSLIEVLAHIDAKVFFAFLLWLEVSSSQKEAEGPTLGWGSYLFSRATEIEQNGDFLSKEASVVAGRMRSIIRGVTIMQMFVQHQGVGYDGS